ncbi:MAG: helix-turn-helix transcriptional regulator [Desulfobulbaceae bacterium]|nr:helix-turn-helix transcriptional regulator [Desulfobulbaceae bacterium]
MTANPKEARIALGLNQTQMAEAMGVARGTWLKWERQEQGITAAPARFLSTLLWLKSHNLFDDWLKDFSE